MLIDLEKQRKTVAERTKEVEAEALRCKERTELAEGIEYDCKEELKKVEPILKKAVRAVSDLSNSDIVEIRGIASPSAGVLLVIKTLCLLFNISPEKKRGTTKDEKEQIDYWSKAKKVLLTPKLLKNCLNFKKDEMKEDVVDAIKEVIETPEYSEGELRKASKAALGLGNWVKVSCLFNSLINYRRWLHMTKQ